MPFPGDLVLSDKAEEGLPALVLLLDCPNGRMWGLVSPAHRESRPGKDRRYATAAAYDAVRTRNVGRP